MDRYWEKIANKYGKDVADKLIPYGKTGKDLIANYGEDFINVVKKMAPDDVAQAIELVDEYGDNAIKLILENNSLFYTKTVLKYGEVSQEFSDWDSMKNYFYRKVTNFMSDCKPMNSRVPKNGLQMVEK
ncbi:MAG: hypothetical protein K6G88_07485 [Lachnospiraceae bacterium]|nr:hypothetical protein [Lachnospiraceae bacterium]